MSTRWPFDQLASAYPRVVDNASWLWRTGFQLTNSRWCSDAVQALAWPVLKPTFHAIRATESPDVIVCTHPLLTAPLRRVFPEVPLAVIVTDLVSGHATWYQRSAQLLVTPTDAARLQAIAHGVPADRTVNLGLPIAPSFASAHHDRRALAAQLGWSLDRPTIVLIGGGDGVGPLESLAAAIDNATLPCDLAIVAGRNAALESRLRQRQWKGTVHTYGFARNLETMLCAASALITKAGPGTISEAFAAGCPLVLCGAIPGQESGNVQLVCDAGAGVWAPSAGAVTAALRAWFVGRAAERTRSAAAACALRAARPRAAAEIAEHVLALAAQHSSPIRAAASRSR
jgi:1,2-diacylglycerol 3-beta-galactosyltransferase